jgi:hypothetical protein
LGAEYELVMLMRNIDPDYLEQLRANAAEVRADLEEREAKDCAHSFLDPLAEHDAIMQATRTMPPTIHKTNMDARRVLLSDDGNGNGDPEPPPPLSDEALDILAQVLAQIRLDFQAAIEDAVAPLNQRIAVLEGQISILTSLLSSDSKSIEATETTRKLHVQR